MRTFERSTEVQLVNLRMLVLENLFKILKNHAVQIFVYLKASSKHKIVSLDAGLDSIGSVLEALRIFVPHQAN